MEQNQNQNQKDSLFYKFSMFSIVAGIFALTSCCNPPMQLVCGAAAVMLAWLSKNGRPMTAPAVVGMVMGIISIVISILVFVQYIWAMDLMADPSNAAMMKEIYRQYQDVFNGLMGTQAAN